MILSYIIQICWNYFLLSFVSELLGFCDITTDWFPEMCIEAPISGACKPCKGGTLLISIFIYRLSDISCQNSNFALTWPSKTQLDWQQCFSAVCSASTKAPAAGLFLTSTVCNSSLSSMLFRTVLASAMQLARNANHLVLLLEMNCC